MFWGCCACLALALVLTVALLAQVSCIHCQAVADADDTTAGARTEFTAFQSDSLREWKVTFSHSIFVRENRSLESEALRQHPPGTVLVGRQVGEWMEPVNESGYVRIFVHSDAENISIVVPRDVYYVASPSGSCGDVRLSPITDVDLCRIAAQQLRIGTAAELQDTTGECRYRTANPAGWGVVCSGDGQLSIDFAPGVPAFHV